jgi:hypothetical protein
LFFGLTFTLYLFFYPVIACVDKSTHLSTHLSTQIRGAVLYMTHLILSPPRVAASIVGTLVPLFNPPLGGVLPI